MESEKKKKQKEMDYHSHHYRTGYHWNRFMRWR